MTITATTNEIKELQEAVSARDVEIARLRAENMRLAKENESHVLSGGNKTWFSVDCPAKGFPPHVIPVDVDSLKKVLGEIDDPSVLSVIGMVLMKSLPQNASLEFYQTITQAIGFPPPKTSLPPHVSVAGNLITQEVNDIHGNNKVNFGTNGN